VDVVDAAARDRWVPGPEVSVGVPASTLARHRTRTHVEV